MTKTGQLTLTNPRVLMHGTDVAASCTYNQEAATISCPQLANTQPGYLGAGKTTLDLVADVSKTGSAAVSVQASLGASGSPESLGSVEWTDGSGIFRWIEGGKNPIATGTLFQ